MRGATCQCRSSAERLSATTMLSSTTSTARPGRSTALASGSSSATEGAGAGTAAAPGRAAGSSKLKTEPLPGAERSATSMPSCPASRRTIASPRPWPCCRLRSTLPTCSKSSNTRVCDSAAMPMPLSRTSTRHARPVSVPGRRRARTASSTRPRGVNLRALSSRLESTRRSATASVQATASAGQRTATRPSPAWRASSFSSGASATAAGRSGSTAASMRPISSSWLVRPSSACCARESEATVCCTAALSVPCCSCWRSTSACSPMAITGWRRSWLAAEKKRSRSAWACSEARRPASACSRSVRSFRRRPMFSSSWREWSATSFHIIAVRPMPITATAIITGAPSHRPVTITGASSSVMASCVAGV
ncbi:hypothetical protein D3C87_890980 [compost metagenome]